MVLVISNPVPVANEAQIINELFDEGMQLFHLRKPACMLREVRTLIEAIKPEYHQRIALHTGFRMAKRFGIKRLHLNNKMRSCFSTSDLGNLKTKGLILSTSVHSQEEYQALNKSFDYSFFGPVFDSISKPGYKAIDQIVAHTKTNTKLAALGGITEHTCTNPQLKSFDKIALLGAIWQSDNAIKTFRSIQEQWSINDR